MKKKKVIIIVTIIILLLCACSVIVVLATVPRTDDDPEKASTVIEDIGSPEISTGKNHEDLTDYEWDEDEVISIDLDNLESDSNNGISIEDSIITINSSGVYRISGELDDGQVLVNTEEEDPIKLLFNNAEISNNSSAPIYIQNASRAVLIVESGTKNYLNDASTYEYSSEEDEEPNGTIFSKSDLSIYGDGYLEIDSNFNDAIISKDGLVLRDIDIAIDSEDDGIRGKDYIIIQGGDLSITSGGDGLKSDNEDNDSCGYIIINDGNVEITANGDMIYGLNNVEINDGKFTLESGSAVYSSGNDSFKGIKSDVAVIINGGSFNIDSYDDAVHSNDYLEINGGDFTIRSEDDAMHADTGLVINDGEIEILDSYEGIESAQIVINNGNIDIVSSDDGINIASGVDGSGAQPRGGRPGGPDNFNVDDDAYLHINSGEIIVNSNGDGLDVNGHIEMNGGTLVIDGPTSNANGALDYDGTFNMNEGTIIAVGSSGMAMAPSSTSSQKSVMVNLNQILSAGTSLTFTNPDEEELLSHTPKKNYQSIVISSPLLDDLDSVELFIGGDLYTEISLAGTITTIGNSGMQGGGHRPGGF